MKRRLRNGLITGWILYIVLGFVIVATVVSWGFAKCAEQEEAQPVAEAPAEEAPAQEEKAEALQAVVAE